MAKNTHMIAKVLQTFDYHFNKPQFNLKCLDLSISQVCCCPKKILHSDRAHRA